MEQLDSGADDGGANPDVRRRRGGREHRDEGVDEDRVEDASCTVSERTGNTPHGEPDHHDENDDADEHQAPTGWCSSHKDRRTGIRRHRPSLTHAAAPGSAARRPAYPDSMTTEPETELSEVLQDLYLRTPTEFVSVRKARARSAKDGGNAELARQISRLQKPATGAWLVNLLVARRADDIDQILELGASLRDAEKNLDGDDLRQLGKQRLQLLRALARQGRDLAEKDGQKVSAAAISDVERTLQAAMTDPHAADAVLSGRLVRALSSNGIEPVDLDGAVAEPSVSTPRSRRPALRVVENKKSAEQIAEAERKATEALARAADADSERDAVRKKRTALSEHRIELGKRRQALEDEIAELARDIAATEREDESLGRAAASAAHAAEVAGRAAERASERLRRLRES